MIARLEFELASYDSAVQHVSHYTSDTHLYKKTVSLFNSISIFLGTKGFTKEYLFIICLDYVFRRSIDKIKENGFKLTKERSRRYPAKTITADDIALLANAPAQAKTLLHSVERAAAGISLHVNAHKTKYMGFNQTGNISTLNSSSLKLVDKFTYLGYCWKSRDVLISDVLL